MASILLLVLLALLQLLARGIALEQVLIASPALAPQELHEYGRVCPMQKCHQWSEVGELEAPGIGFALETSHG